MAAGMFWAFDLGTHLGWAHGRPGGQPQSGSIFLREDDRTRDEGFARLIRFLHNNWQHERPALVAIEDRMKVQGLLAARRGGKGRNSDASIFATYALHGIVRGMARVYLAPIEAVPIATHRKHFLGKASMGSREETNLSVLHRCKTMKLVPPDCQDWDRANALSVLDWAVANFGTRSGITNQLYLTGE